MEQQPGSDEHPSPETEASAIQTAETRPTQSSCAPPQCLRLQRTLYISQPNSLTKTKIVPQALGNQGIFKIPLKCIK